MEYCYQTQRLEIRVLDVSAAPMVLDFLSRNRAEFERWDPKHVSDFYTIPYQQQALAAEQRLLLLQKGIRFYIFLKDVPDTIIGCVSFAHLTPENGGSCFLGYKLDRDYRHFGYAYEAISCLLPQIMSGFPVTRIEADIQPANTESVSLIKKLGFVSDPIPVFLETGRTHGEKQPHVRYFYLGRRIV